TALTHLDNIGLIRFDGLAGFVRRAFPKRAGVAYYGTIVGIEFTNEKDNDLDLGKVLLSQIGAQLALICGSRPNSVFMEYVLERWSKNGAVPFSPYPRVTTEPPARPANCSPG
ncbi:MAG TPA: hypothetical protein VH370_24980, partial [Humisphaera sp.]|nr:hypothetical protein [Humisphaera sp.]